MNNEIKQGDKVRVREDAPEILRKIIPSKVFDEESKVVAIDSEMAVVWTEPIHKNLIPTKYLVKVEAEEKEAKFKKGDKVRYIGDIQEHKGEIFVIDGDIFFNDYYKQWQASSIKTTPTEVWGICNVPLSDLEPDTKPTEQTEAEKTKTKGDTLTFPIAFNLTDSYWDAYAADLAKDIALKVANKYNDPEEAAEYAVSVAKAVVEGLKRE